MFKKLTFGQYFHKNTTIHKLDPRIKIISVVILSIVAFLIDSYLKIIVFSLLILFIAISAKLKFSSLIRNLRPFFYIFLFILLMYLFFSRNELYMGILTIWKFVLFIIIASILTFTATITNLVTAIEKLLKPLGLVKINTRDISLLIALTIRFIPSLFLYADRLKDARLSRLGNLKNPKQIKSLFVTLLDRLFKSASTLSDAMLGRNYSSKRTSYYNIIKIKYFDYLSIIFLIIVLFVFFRIG